MNKKPKPNMTESVLARAELYRRGMMFEGVPQMSTTELELPAGTADAAPGAAPAAPAGDSQALPAVPAGAPETTDALVAGAIKQDSPLETMVAGA